MMVYIYICTTLITKQGDADIVKKNLPFGRGKKDCITLFS